MAKVEIQGAFVEDRIGDPVFVLKIAEPHSRKDDQGKYQTVSRTFYDVKVSRESGIDLSRFAKDSRVAVRGTQRTEVREHNGKKYYTLTVWADSVEAVESQQSGQSSQGSWGAPQNTAQGFGGGFDDAQPF